MICPKCKEYTSWRYARCPHCGNAQPVPSPREISAHFLRFRNKQHAPMLDESDWFGEFVEWQVDNVGYRELRF